MGDGMVGVLSSLSLQKFPLLENRDYEEFQTHTLRG
jgi:hypothetical protein